MRSEEGGTRRDQFDFFSWTAQTYGIGNISAPAAAIDTFRASVDQISVGSAVFVEVSAEPLVLERTARDVAHADRDLFTIGVLLKGESLQYQGNREARLSASDFVLIDSRQPFLIRYDRPFRHLLVNFNRAQVAARLPAAERLTATRIDGRSGVASVTGALLRSIQEQACGLAGAEDALVEHALDLLALTFHGSISETGAQRVLLTRIQAYIEANLGNPALSASGIATYHNISRRYLYRLFEGISESVCDFMRRRRLERCRAALADPRQNVRSMSEIAFAWGFNDASHFSHAFSKAYGMSPREYRRSAQR